MNRPLLVRQAERYAHVFLCTGPPGQASFWLPAPGASRSSAAARERRGLHVEAEFDDVAVAHDVVLALDADLADCAGRGQRTGRDQVVVGDDLGLDEAALEVGVDDPRRLRGGRAGPDRPGPGFLGARGQEGLQAERAEAG